MASGFYCSHRIGPLEEYVDCIYDNRLKAHCYVRMASDLFKDAISNLTETSYKTALHALKECRRPIEEAKRLAGAWRTCQSTELYVIYWSPLIASYIMHSVFFFLYKSVVRHMLRCSFSTRWWYRWCWNHIHRDRNTCARGRQLPASLHCRIYTSATHRSHKQFVRKTQILLPVMFRCQAN